MKNNEKIIGRDQQCELLAQLLQSNKAEFLAIYGRRRVGKTYLVNQFFKKKAPFFFYSSGVLDAPIEEQIQQFTLEIGRVFYNGAKLEQKESWLNTFEMLTHAINGIKDNQKIVLFFDELPWMATHRSRLLPALDFYWNRHWSHNPNVKLIICGSSASWIINNIINNKAGLHNRLTKRMALAPLSLYETKLYLKHRGIKLNNKHITQLYMAMGGIPHYLSEIRSGKTSAEIIDQLAFNKEGLLLNEFDRLYASLFKNSETHVELIREIAKKQYGISQADLFIQAKASRGGTISKKLKELEDAGFIISFKPFQHSKKGIFYKVIDEYSLFYLKWVEPVHNTLINKSLRKGYWESLCNTPGWYSWAGLAFESICYKHVNQISKTLELAPTALAHTWRHTAKNQTGSGAQIDLLFDRQDDAITWCEIKYTEKPFTIDKEYAKKLINRQTTFQKITGTTKQLFFVMISATGIKPSMYSEELVDNVVCLDDLFKDKE